MADGHGGPVGIPSQAAALRGVGFPAAAEHRRILRDQAPPADPGMVPLTVPETARLLAHPPPPGASGHWLAWRRRHQALSAWYHQRTRLTRDEQILLVS